MPSTTASLSASPLKAHDDIALADHNIFGCKYMGVSRMPPEYRDSLSKVTEFCDQFEDASKRIKELGSQLMYH